MSLEWWWVWGISPSKTWWRYGLVILQVMANLRGTMTFSSMIFSAINLYLVLAVWEFQSSHVWGHCCHGAKHSRTSRDDLLTMQFLLPTILQPSMCSSSFWGASQQACSTGMKQGWEQRSKPLSLKMAVWPNFLENWRSMRTSFPTFRSKKSTWSSSTWNCKGSLLLDKKWVTLSSSGIVSWTEESSTMWVKFPKIILPPNQLLMRKNGSQLASMSSRSKSWRL